jgi:hypothetical protein
MRATKLGLDPAVFHKYYEKVGFLENRCNTVKKADTVAQPLRERFQKLKTDVTPLKMQKLFIISGHDS